MHPYLNMVGKIGFVLGCLGCLFLAARSTLDSRIQEKGPVFSSLSPRDQALAKSGTIREGPPKDAVYSAWGAPAQIRAGSRNGHPYEAWVYTTLKTVFVSDFYYPPLLPFRVVSLLRLLSICHLSFVIRHLLSPASCLTIPSLLSLRN